MPESPDITQHEIAVSLVKRYCQARRLDIPRDLESNMPSIRISALEAGLILTFILRACGDRGSGQKRHITLEITDLFNKIWMLGKVHPCVIISKKI